MQLCTQVSDLVDAIVLDIFEAAIEDYPECAASVALVPHGGYGRREMAPHSDIDLMLLHAAPSEKAIAPLAQRLVRDLCDSGFDVGFSLRTPPQCTRLIVQDPIIFSSLVDSRLLAGSVGLFTQFWHRTTRTIRRRGQQLIAATVTARKEERSKYGDTVYLLEPNLKRSRGGLRDLQMIRWIGQARYGAANLEHLRQAGHLTRPDYRALRDAKEFLLWLRNELHFHAGRARDVFTRDEQLRIAKQSGLTGQAGLLPVEQFMQRYFHHTSNVRNIVAHFLDGARWTYPRLRQVTRTLVSHQVEGDFRVGQFHIAATRCGLQKVTTRLSDVLRLMDLASRYDCRIDHPTWQAVRAAMIARDDVQVDQEATERFLSFLSQPNRLGQYLRRLHELRVLEKLVPGFDHARCLLQFNEYHKYTVDEHSIRAVQEATEFLRDEGPVGDAYRSIADKQILHLALLVHDLGKGFVEDHSEVGARLAVDVAQRLHLDEEEAETLQFLVHRHLMLSHLAFQRDWSDAKVILEHAAEIGSTDRLTKLFVLSCADLAAVGPGVLTQWKKQVLTDVYRQLRDALSGGGPLDSSADPVAGQRAELLESLPNDSLGPWLAEQIKHLPAAYLQGPSAEHILDDLRRLHELAPRQAVAWGRYLPDRKAVEYSVGVHEEGASGIFHRLTGALMSNRLEILSAEIHSLHGGLCLDRFYVEDLGFDGRPPESRQREVSQALAEAVEQRCEFVPRFPATWQERRQTPGEHALPTRVRIDNKTSAAHTIIDIFAHDRPGLLFVIARTLHELGLSVAAARVGTYLDQVVDVFYVTTASGVKLEEPQRIADVRDALLNAIHADR